MFETRKVYRNGLIFQVPTSIFSSCRYMGVHADGSGTSWDEDSPDIDQPHGLDYRSHQDIRKGTRKRTGKEHRVFADATVGGEHLPGGCRILGIVESTEDLTIGAGDASIDITDGKFQGRGLIYDQTRNALWCYTGDGTVSDAPYLLALHPDRAWAGGDVTWSGVHQFDALVSFEAGIGSDVDITGNVAIDGDFTVDGTCAFDATGIEFGGTAGIGLFYDPTAYIGGESVTFPNGLIFKHGYKAFTGTTATITFADAFPTEIVSAQGTPYDTGAVDADYMTLTARSAAALTFKTRNTQFVSLYWEAWGR